MSKTFIDLRVRLIVDDSNMGRYRSGTAHAQRMRESAQKQLEDLIARQPMVLSSAENQVEHVEVAAGISRIADFGRRIWEVGILYPEYENSYCTYVTNANTMDEAQIEAIAEITRIEGEMPEYEIMSTRLVWDPETA
jgi:hypothetical protein